jgi:hypothetical protein
MGNDAHANKTPVGDSLVWNESIRRWYDNFMKKGWMCNWQSTTEQVVGRIKEVLVRIPNKPLTGLGIPVTAYGIISRTFHFKPD